MITFAIIAAEYSLERISICGAKPGVAGVFVVGVLLCTVYRQPNCQWAGSESASLYEG